MLSFEFRRWVEKYKSTVFRLRDYRSWTGSSEYSTLLMGNILVGLACGLSLWLLWKLAGILAMVLPTVMGVVHWVLLVFTIVTLLLVGGFLYLSTLAGCMRRLNSLGVSPWWIVLYFLPITSGIFVIWLLFPQNSFTQS